MYLDIKKQWGKEYKGTTVYIMLQLLRIFFPVEKIIKKVPIVRK